MYTRDFQERKKFEHFFYSWWSIFGTTVFLAIVFIGIVGLWRKERALTDELAVLNAKITEMKAAREKNSLKLRSLNTEAGIETEARGKFNLKKEGEEMVVFLEDINRTEKKEGFWAEAEASTAHIWQKLKNWLRF